MVYIHLSSTPDTRDLVILSITPDTRILLKSLVYFLTQVYLNLLKVYMITSSVLILLYSG